MMSLNFKKGVTNKNHMTFRLVFFSFLFLFELTYSQSKTIENPDHYVWFDKFIGIENTGLYNGIQYVEKYKPIHKKHQFFKSSDFVKGQITYNTQRYYDVLMKYNVFEDKILIKLLDKFGGNTIQLNTNDVTDFVIDKSKFLNLSTNKNTLISVGFCEVLLEYDVFNFYKKNKKIKKELFREETVFYDFLDKHLYILLYKDIYHEVNSKSDLNRVFPEFKEDINKFYTSNRAIRKSKPDVFWTLLLKKIYSKISNKKKNTI